MSNKILRPEVQIFIQDNFDKDLNVLLLQKTPFPGLAMSEIVQQIRGRRIAQKKFPFLNRPDIIFPPHINLEQSSSEATALYKMQFFQGRYFADLTLGFGIDAYFLSKKFEKITLVEQDGDLLNIIKDNWKALNRNANFVQGTAEKFLSEIEQFQDLIYLDPARRDQNQNKVFLLEDLSPNILELQDHLNNNAQNTLIKLSPLIDIAYLIKTLKHISEIHVVGVKNEVKEILVLLKNKYQGDAVKIRCSNLETSEPNFEFNFEELSVAQAKYSEPRNYLYIPNNVILKSGAFQLLSERFNLFKLHPNTHLYTSDIKTEHFPGRILSVETISSADLKKGDQYNIISKNHPLKPADIKKKYKIKDGGLRYLIFTQSTGRKIILRSN